MHHSLALDVNSIRILDHIPLGILILDSDYRVLLWNKCLEYWTGVTEDQLKGLDIRQQYPLFAEKRFSTRIATIFQGGPPIIFSSHIHKYIIPASLPNNVMRLQHVSVSPLLQEDGRFLGLFTIQDVTEVNLRLTQRKKAEEELREVLARLEETNLKLEQSSSLAIQKAREADEANEAKSVFLANMSHEIRTPMSGILGVLDMLASSEQDREKRDLLRMTKDSANTLLAIINDILDLSKVEAGKLELSAADVKLRPILDRTIRLYSVPAQGKGLRLEHALSPDLPEWAHVDATKLEQVLRNLLDNAVKFTPQGEVFLGAEVVETTSDAHVVRFWVRDTGVGIAEKSISTLFQPFSQIDSTYAKTAGGTGLGLTLCKRIVELMGGAMDVRSEPGQGSTFSAIIPLRFARDPHLEETSPEAPPPASAPSLRTVRVLVAEDDLLIQKYLTHILAHQGCRFDIVSSGAEAVAAYQRATYDIILMDIQMPEMDGLEATRRIRAIEEGRQRTEDSEQKTHEETAPVDPVRDPSPVPRPPAGRRIPIIALTAYAMNEEREKFLARGMDGFSPKPIQADHLVQEITRLLGASRQEDRALIAQQPLLSGFALAEPEQTAPLPDVFDRKDLQARYHGNHGLWTMLSNLFARQELPLYRQQLSSGENLLDDLVSLARLAHKLKGALGTICATPGYHIALEMEQTARNEDRDGASAAVASMLSELDRIETHLATHRAET